MSADQRDLILISKPTRLPMSGLDVPHGCSVIVADGNDGDRFQHGKHVLGSEMETLTRLQMNDLVKKCYQEDIWLMLRQQQGSIARTPEQLYSRLQDILQIARPEADSEETPNESEKRPLQQPMQRVLDHSRVPQSINLTRAPRCGDFSGSSPLFFLPRDGTVVFAADRDILDTFYYFVDAEGLEYEDAVWRPLTKAEAQRIAKQAHKEGHWLAAQHVSGAAASSILQMTQRLQEIIGFPSHEAEPTETGAVSQIG